MSMHNYVTPQDDHELYIREGDDSRCMLRHIVLSVQIMKPLETICDRLA